VHYIAQVFIFLGVVCRIFLGASRAWGNFIMSMARYGLGLALASGSVNDTICNQVPTTIDAALNHFNLQGKTTTYAVCPECHCTYKPEWPPGSSTPLYPVLCSNTLLPETGGHTSPFTCGASLIEDGDRSQPIKTFLYYSFHDYLAGLLSRPDLERFIDSYCDDFMDSLTRPPPEFVTDVSEADFFKEFNGPDGKLFLDRGGELRTAFTLNVDFFDVEGMSQRGRKTSCGIIAMSCLNLPGSIRYKPENMYLAGIVPGPTAPHLTDLNHYLDPLIDDMVESYNRGVFYSRTPSQASGRISRSAIAAAVNDLPGGRKVAALASHNSHHYCFICNTKGLEKLGDHNCHQWPRKDLQLMRTHAEEWRDAPDSATKLQIFNDHGVRWSSMWRLPYWNPMKQLVIDAMHCILEGLVQYHFRHVLFLTSSDSGRPSKPIAAFSHNFRSATEEDGLNAKGCKQVDKIHRLLTAPLEGGSPEAIAKSLDQLKIDLEKVTLPALDFVGRDLGRVPAAGRRITKKLWSREMVEWVGSSRDCEYSCANPLVEEDQGLYRRLSICWCHSSRNVSYPSSDYTNGNTVTHQFSSSQLRRVQSRNIES
jgi:hypothetical protein